MNAQDRRAARLAQNRKVARAALALADLRRTAAVERAARDFRPTTPMRG